MELSQTARENAVETIFPNEANQSMVAEVSNCIISLPQRIKFDCRTQFSSVNYLGPAPCFLNPWVNIDTSSINTNNEMKYNETKNHPEEKSSSKQSSFGSDVRNIDFRNLPVPDTIPIMEVEKKPSRKQKRAQLITSLLEEEEAELVCARKDDGADVKGDESKKSSDNKHGGNDISYHSSRHISMYEADEKKLDSFRRERKQMSEVDREDDDRKTYK